MIDILASFGWWVHCMIGGFVLAIVIGIIVTCLQSFSSRQFVWDGRRLHCYKWDRLDNTPDWLVPAIEERREPGVQHILICSTDTYMVQFARDGGSYQLYQKRC